MCARLSIKHTGFNGRMHIPAARDEQYGKNGSLVARVRCASDSLGSSSSLEKQAPVFFDDAIACHKIVTHAVWTLAVFL